MDAGEDKAELNEQQFSAATGCVYKNSIEILATEADGFFDCTVGGLTGTVGSSLKMSLAQPLRNGDGEARGLMTARSATKRQLAAANQRIEQLDEPVPDGVAFQMTYNSALEMEPSFPNETLMSPPQGNGLGEDRSWFGIISGMHMIRKDIMSRGYEQQLPSGRDALVDWMEMNPWYHDTLFLGYGMHDPSYEEAKAEVDVQQLLVDMGADGDEDETTPHHTDMQTVLPLRGTSDAALSDIDPEDESTLLSKGTMTERCPVPPNVFLSPFTTTFNQPLLEGLRDLPFLEAQLSWLQWQREVAASESSATVSTESKYTFQGQTINGHTHILASDFRAQLQTAPPPTKKAKYPFTFSDREGVAPELPHPLLHIPVVPGRKEGFRNGIDDPDVLRVIYPRDRAKGGAVLARHDPEAGRTASGNGVMKRCNYHGARHRRGKGGGGGGSVVVNWSDCGVGYVECVWYYGEAGKK